MTNWPMDPSGLDERLWELKRISAHHSEHSRIRDEIILACVPFVRSLARRFNGRGEPLDDLLQVGMVGLIMAVDRFDPERGSRFLAYATPTVLGEIKRYFRDRGWAIRPPRCVQQLRSDEREARARLTQVLHRTPTTAELATDLKVTEEEVVEAISVGEQYHNLSLDKQLSDEPGNSTYADILGEEDTQLDFVEYRITANPLLNALPDRERRILLLWYHGEKTQLEIAAEVGLSQMQVSRLISKSLARMRAQVYS